MVQYIGSRILRNTSLTIATMNCTTRINLKLKSKPQSVSTLLVPLRCGRHPAYSWQDERCNSPCQPSFTAAVGRRRRLEVAACSWQDDRSDSSRQSTARFTAAIGSALLSLTVSVCAVLQPVLHPPSAHASASSVAYENSIKGHATGPRSSSGEAQGFLTLSKDLFTEDAWQGMSE